MPGFHGQANLFLWAVLYRIRENSSSLPLDPWGKIGYYTFMKAQIEQILERLRPNLAMHRGNVELVGVDEETGIVRVRFLGTCDGCALASLTLKMGIESVLVDEVPGVTEVVAVNDAV